MTDRSPLRGKLTFLLCRSYTSHFNLTDFPAIAFPVGGRVDPELDSITPEEALNYVPLSEDDRIAHESCA